MKDVDSSSRAGSALDDKMGLVRRFRLVPRCDIPVSESQLLSCSWSSMRPALGFRVSFVASGGSKDSHPVVAMSFTFGSGISSRRLVKHYWSRILEGHNKHLRVDGRYFGRSA